MKKFAALVMGLVLLTPVSFAQDDGRTEGSYNGTVPGLCLVRTDLRGGNLQTADNNQDQFVDGFTGTDSYGYQSNTGCTATYFANKTSGPEDVTIGTNGDELSCNGASPLGVAQTTAPVDTTFTFKDGDGILLAGQYTFTCTVNLTANN